MRHGFIKTAAGTPKIQVADCRGDSEADPADGNRGCKDHGISGALYHRIYLSGSVLADIASGQCERAADMAGKGDQSGGRADHCRPSMGI